MAKIRMGVMVGQASGSLGSTVFSHGRYGAYVRLRSVPTKATSNYAQQAKAFLAASSAAWQAYTTAQQLAWQTWAQGHPITDALGDQQVLSGHAAAVMLNTRLRHIAGTPITDPPTAVPPPALLTLTGSYDIGVGNFEAAFTATPLAATHQLQLRAAVVGSAGIHYVKNLLKLTETSAAAQASPLATIDVNIEARFGTLQVGNKVTIYANVIDNATGLISAPLIDSGIVVST